MQTQSHVSQPIGSSVNVTIHSSAGIDKLLTSKLKRKRTDKKSKSFVYEESEKMIWIIAQYINDPNKKSSLRAKEFWNITLPKEMATFGFESRLNEDMKGLMSKNPYYKRWKYIEAQFGRGCLDAGFQGGADLLHAPATAIRQLRCHIDHFDTVFSYKTNPELCDDIASLSHGESDEDDVIDGQSLIEMPLDSSQQQQTYNPIKRPRPDQSSLALQYNFSAMDRLRQVEMHSKHTEIANQQSIDESLTGMRTMIRELSLKVDSIQSSQLLTNLLLIRLTRLYETDKKEDLPQLLQMITSIETQVFGQSFHPSSSNNNEDSDGFQDK